MKKHFNLTLSLLFALMFLSSHGFAQIVSYTSATDGSLASVATHATGTALARVNGATSPGSACSTGFNSAGYSTTTTYSSSLAAIEVTVAAASGYQLNVTGFSADMRRSASGPGSVRFAYSTDGTTWTDQGSNQTPNNASCGTTTTGTWTTNFSVGSSSTLRFRIYDFNASSTAGTFQLLNVIINGTVASACVAPTLSTSVTNVSCNGGSNGAIALTCTGGTSPFTYSWSNGATTQNISSLVAGSYSVTVTATGGCTSSTSATVTQPSALSASITAQTNVACGGTNGTATVTASGGTTPYTYSWSTSPVQTTSAATGLSATSYTATVTDAKSCSANAVVTIVILVPSSLAATGITSTGATLGWGAVSGASSYNVQYRQTGTSTWTSSSSSTTSVAVSGLTASTSYEFQVQTVCSGTTSAFSSSANFTTTGSGGSGTILSFTTATDGSLNSVDPNATGTALARVNGSNAPGSPCSTGLTSKNFTSATTYSTSLAANEVTVTPNTGYTLNVTGFSADMRRSSTGPSSIRYAYSLDGGTTWIDQGSDQAPNNSSCGTTTTGTWTTSFTVAAPGTLKFRLYAYNASSTAGVLQVQNLTISGTVTGGGGVATLNPKFTIYFNNPVDTTVSTGVRAKYLYHCLADTLIAYINRAKYTIDIAQYEYNQTSGFSNIATAVNNAYSRGVVIRWIYDSTINNSGLSTLNSAIPTLSSPAGGSISPCHKQYTIMHNKFVLIDANSSNANDPYVWTGSPDWNVTQFNSDFNNVVIIQDSALAHAYTAQFNTMWGSTTTTPNPSASLWGPCKSNSGRHSFNINGTPVELYFTPSDSVNAHILSTLQTANTDLYFGMYTFTDVPDASQLVTAYNSGLTVDGIVDHYSITYAAYDTLLAHLDTTNLKVYTGGYIYHNKYVIVDPSNTCSDPIVLTGSHNWTASADAQNDENTLIIHDATIANLYYQAFKQDFTTLHGSLSHVTVGGGCGTTYHKENNEPVNIGVTALEHVTVYPNPSNGEFTLQYTLAETNNVSIDVMNMVGQHVATLKNGEQQESGTYTMNFQLPAPGIYFIKVSQGNSMKILKVIRL